MKPDLRYLQAQQLHASRRLSPSFARNVIEEARRRGRVRYQLRLALVTGALCMVTAIGANLLRNHLTDQASLQAWTQAAVRLQPFEETI